MNNIFQENKNGNIIPIFKNDLKKDDFISFFSSINIPKKMKEIILFLKNIIKENPEIGQILLDINDIYKLEKGLIEILIEEYILKQNDERINQLLYNFFVFISNPFQIRKNIYDYIYKIISKLFQNVKENINLNSEIFIKSIDLLNIFYSKKENPEIINFKDNFFYLFDNEIKTNINENNHLEINTLNIEFYFFINQNYINESSIILKIEFSNKEEIIIKFGTQNNISQTIEILYNITNNNDSNFKKNSIIEFGEWNKFKLKISNKEKDKNIVFYINKDEFVINLNNQIYEISDLLFYSKFHGLISPILISEIDLKNNNFFSKDYIYPLYNSYNHNNNINELNTNIKNNTNINESFIENEKNCFILKNNHNKIPLIFFIKDISNKKRNINEIIPLFQKKNFPNFYEYNFINLKENIYLIGGTKNILPLYELISLFQKENYQIITFIEKISQLSVTIFSSENNIEESLYSKSIIIFSQFINSFYNENNNKYFSQIIEEIMEKNIHNDDIFLNFKDILLNKIFLLNLSEKRKVAYIKFISNLNKYKNIVFYYLIELIKKENINEQFIQQIFFNFFFDILNKEDYTKILDLILILENNKINTIIKGNLLKLLIKLIDIQIPENNKNKYIKTQKEEIIKILNSKEKELEKMKLNLSQNLTKKKEINSENFIGLIEQTLEFKYPSEEGIEDLLEKKLKIFSFICEQKLLSYIVEFSKINNPSIKIDLIYFFQLIVFYYMQYFNLKNINPNNEKFILESFQNENKELINTNNKDIIFDKIILDYKNIVDITLNIKYNDDNILKNLNNYKLEILEYLKNFFSLIRNNNYLFCNENNFDKKIKIDFGNLYYSRAFLVRLISLFHHIFQLKEREKDNILITEIQNQINNVILDIYYDGIRAGPICFLEILEQFDWYIYDHKEDISNNFRQYFFSIFLNKIPITYQTNSELSIFMNNIQNLLFMGKSNYSVIELYIALTKKDHCKKNISLIIDSLKLQNLDYFILNNFLLFYELIIIKINNLVFYLKDFVGFIIFCFLIYDNNISQSYSKSSNNYFFIGIVLLSIKSILLQIYSNENINSQLYLVISIFMRMIYKSLNRNPENKLYNYFYEKYKRNTSISIFFKIFHSKFDQHNEEKTKKNSKDIIISMKEELLKLFRKIEPIRFPKYSIFPEILEQMNVKNTKLINQNKKKENFKSNIEKFQVEKNYKKIKKKIFSWNGSYSNLNLFYTEEGKKQLKYRILNHYTKEMTLPFLKPILNLKSYLPLNYEKLFINEYKGINLYDDNFINNDFNILYNFLLNKKIMPDYDNSNIISFFKLKEKDFYYCCLIKIGMHIPGFLILKSEKIIFIGFPNRKMKDEENFYCDKDENCFGSFIKNKKMYFLKLKFENISLAYKKIYAFKDNALEIFTKDNKSYYFEFNDNIKKSNKNINNNENNDISVSILSFESINRGNQSDSSFHLIVNDEVNNNILYNTKIRNKVFYKIYNYIYKDISYNETEEIRFFSKSKSNNLIELIIDNFKNKYISKLEYLIKINLLSNRSFNDINQYPIFPWILLNYNSSIENNNLNKILRKLDNPIGILNEKMRKSYKENYEFKMKIFKEKYPNIHINLSDINTIKKLKIPINYIPVLFNSHYSNPSYVSFYMKRIFPYFLISKEIEGENNENPERNFIDLNNTFLNCINTKGNLKELIPEFFYLPEIFRNINQLNLGFTKSKNLNTQIKIDDVNLPFWSSNNPENFITKFRVIFESDEIEINKWVNLIFGCSQNENENLKIKNLYMPSCYNGFIELENIPFNERYSYMQLFNIGINPIQIFKKELKDYSKKKIKDNKEKNQNNDIIGYIEKNFKESLKNKNSKIIILLERLKNPNEKYQFKNYKNKYYVLYNFFSGEIFILISNTKNLIEIRNSDTKSLIKPSIFDNSEITSIYNDSKLIFFGTRLGSIIKYKIGKFNIDNIIHSHTKKIKSLYNDKVLHCLIDSSDDGYVNIYTLPNLNIIQSIYDPYFIGDIVLLSHSPLPSFYIYNYEKKSFRAFSVNGRKLLENDKIIENVYNVVIKNDYNHIEYLEIKDKNDKIRQFQLPYFEVRIPQNIITKKEKEK